MQGGITIADVQVTDPNTNLDIFRHANDRLWLSQDKSKGRSYL